MKRLITYILIIVFAGGMAVPAHAGNPQILSFFSLGPSLAQGKPLKLFWDARGADLCTASGGWSGVKALTGTEDVPAPTMTTTYTINCQQGTLSTSRSFSVYVNPPRVPFLFDTPTTEVLLTRGASLTLDWYAAPVTRSCSLDLNGYRLTDRPAFGSELITPAQAGRSLYTIECTRYDATTSQGSVAITIYPALAENQIDFSAVRWGGKYGDLTVAAVQPYNPAIPASIQNFQIHLKGKTTLTGTYRYNEEDDGPFFERNRVCLYDLDAESQKKIPRVAGVSQSGTKVCFRNDAQAREWFKPRGSIGKATVIIDGYTLVGNWENRPDEAYLSRLESKQIWSPLTFTVPSETKVVQKKAKAPRQVIKRSALVQRIPAKPRKPIFKKPLARPPTQKQLIPKIEPLQPQITYDTI